MCYTIPTSLLLDNKRTENGNSASPAEVNIKGKALVVANEVSKDSRFNVEKLKSWTGRDVVSVRPLYGKQINFHPTHVLCLLCNDFPKIEAEDFAFWERCIVVPFNVTFVDNPKKQGEKKKDRDMENKIKSEAKGILKWAVEGATLWQKEGLNIPEVCINAIKEYRYENDDIQHFLDQCCIKCDGGRVTLDVLYSKYRTWCVKYFINPVNSNNFAKILTQKGIGVTHSGSKRYRKGIKIIEEVKDN